VKRPRPLELGLFVEVPVLATGFVAWQVIRGGWASGWGGDFRIFRAAGHALLHGRSPYVEPTVRLLTGDDRFVYPAPFALLFAPFNLLGPTASTLVYLVLSAAAVLLALHLLGVTDWRCYGAALVGAGTYGSFCVGSIGPFLLLGLAAGWRYRDRASAGVWLALVAAAKLFLWPVLLWLIVTRRFRATAASAATLIGIVCLWAMLDLHGLHTYPTTLRVLDEVERWKSYSPESLALALGASPSAAHALALALAAAGVVVMFVDRDERRALIVAVCVALLASPILWMHYTILLLAPIALARPRLAAIWGLPVVLWVTARPDSDGTVWRIVFGIAVIAVTTLVVRRASRPPDEESADRPVGSAETPHAVTA
jgi:alpha-1,2-mannosyltransferase